jgi:uncharacterized protein YndB with AHSA1/START domain
MLETLVIFALVLALVAAFVLARTARRPDTFTFARSTVVQAPAERVFPLIADPVTFNTWNPFNEDPSITGAYSGPLRGPGARYSFESKRAGTGYTEIVEEAFPRRLVVRLVMTRPFACDNRVEFHVDPVPDGSRVTWSMSGPMNFMAKMMNQVINCERMTGGQFEKGLAKLKSIAEGQSQPAAPETA